MTREKVPSRIQNLSEFQIENQTTVLEAILRKKVAIEF